MENLTGVSPPARPLPCVVPCKLYFGYSTENTQANKKADAKGFRGLLTRSADEFALQEESLWQSDVIEAILDLYSFNK